MHTLFSSMYLQYATEWDEFADFIMEKAVAFEKTVNEDEASMAEISEYNEVLIDEAARHTEFGKIINSVSYIPRTDMLAVIEEGSREIALFSAETARRVADLDFREVVSTAS